MKFKSTINKFLYFFLILMVFITFLPFIFEGEINLFSIVYTFIILLITLFVFWAIKSNCYIIKGENLILKSAFIKKIIPIKSIREIEKYNGFLPPTLLKLGLNHKGIVIRYNKYDDIYISPKELSSFIKELNKINPEILIK